MSTWKIVPVLCLAVAFALPALVAAEPSGPAPDLRTRKSGSDWPRFLGPTGDSKSTEKILKDWPEEGLPILWFTRMGEGYSMPSISKGRLFTFDRHGDQVRLSAVRSETGEKLWTTEYPTDYEDYYDYSGGPRASPVIDEDRVFVFGVEGRLRAHDVADGELLWEIDTTKRYGVVKNFFGVGSTPVVEGDLLIVQVGGSPEDSPKIHSGEVKGNGTGIVAFDKRTGKERWAATDELASYSSPRIVTIGDRRWGFLFTRGGLVGFEPTKGEVDFFYPWRAKVLESVNAATPVVVGDTVFITETYGPGSSLLKVRPGGYDVIWKDPPRGKSMESHWSTPVYVDGHLYGSSGRSAGNAELRCIEHLTGKVKWSVPELTRSTLLHADGHLIVLTEYGRLLLVKVNPERYELVAEMDLSEKKDVAARERLSDEEGASEQVDPQKTRADAGVDANAKKPIDETSTDRPVLRHPAWNAPILSHGLLYVRGKDELICLDISPAAS